MGNASKAHYVASTQSPVNLVRINPLLVDRRSLRLPVVAYLFEFQLGSTYNLYRPLRGALRNMPPLMIQRLPSKNRNRFGLGFYTL